MRVDSTPKMEIRIGVSFTQSDRCGQVISWLWSGDLMVVVRWSVCWGVSAVRPVSEAGHCYSGIHDAPWDHRGNTASAATVSTACGLHVVPAKS